MTQCINSKNGGAGSSGGFPFSGGIPGIYGDHVSALLDGGVDQYDLLGNGLTPHIGTAWRMVDPVTDGTVSGNLMGGSDFGSLSFVAQLGVHNGSFGELLLIPDPGYVVVLNSFSLAAMFTGDATAQTARVLDSAFATLWTTEIPIVPATGQLDFAPAIVSADPIRLQFGPGMIGLGMVNFDERPLPPAPEPAPVPEPPTIGLFFLGTLVVFGHSILVSRRRS